MTHEEECCLDEMTHQKQNSSTMLEDLQVHTNIIKAPAQSTYVNQGGMTHAHKGRELTDCMYTCAFAAPTESKKPMMPSKHETLQNMRTILDVVIKHCCML